MFSPTEIQSLLNLIKKNSLFYIASQLGKHLLLPDDKTFLVSQGIDLSKIKTVHSSVEQAYLFGHISTLLENNAVKKMSFKEFQNYVTSEKWIPLVNREVEALKTVEQFAYNEIIGLGGKQSQKILNKTNELEQRVRSIKDKSKEAIHRRDTKTWLSSELRELTKDWDRDWGRVSDYIMTSAYSTGSTEAAKKRAGDKAKVWMSVYPQACKHCIKAYLTNGIGSRPVVFLVSDLEANGTNIGKKVDDTKPVVPPFHPHCRCDPNFFDDGSEWDEKTKTFRKPKYKSKYEPLVKVTIDGKSYEG